MYIYLDESYNLKDREKKQFISINGFSVIDERYLFKRWKEYRRPFTTKKRRIHAVDDTFKELRPKVLNLINRPDLTLLSVFQVLQEIPFDRTSNYFYKGKPNFDKIYLDLVIELLNKLNLEEYDNVKIIIDSRKYRGGISGKEVFKKEVTNFLNTNYDKFGFGFKIQPSSTDVLLELADFISNILYRAYIADDEQFFKDWEYKLIKIENPLK